MDCYKNVSFHLRYASFDFVIALIIVLEPVRLPKDWLLKLE